MNIHTHGANTCGGQSTPLIPVFAPPQAPLLSIFCMEEMYRLSTHMSREKLTLLTCRSSWCSAMRCWKFCMTTLPKPKQRWRPKQIHTIGNWPSKKWMLYFFAYNPTNNAPFPNKGTLSYHLSFLALTKFLSVWELPSSSQIISSSMYQCFGLLMTKPLAHHFLHFPFPLTGIAPYFN